MSLLEYHDEIGRLVSWQLEGVRHEPVWRVTISDGKCAGVGVDRDPSMAYAAAYSWLSHVTRGTEPPRQAPRHLEKRDMRRYRP